MSDGRGSALASYAELLATSRRVDWRFLLPDPELGHVACNARVDPALRRACELVAERVTVFGDDSQPNAPVDVLVLRDPSSATLRRAPDLVRAGGWVYVETRGELRGRGRRTARPGNVRHIAAELGALGLEDVQAHWHWPDFDTCTELLPLDDAAAIRGALERRLGSARRSARLWVARAAVRTGALSLLVPHASVLARRPAGPRS